MEKSRNAFAIAKSMGHVELKSMEPYQLQELQPLRETINQRNQRKKMVRFWRMKRLEQVTHHRHLLDGKPVKWWTRKESNLQPVD